MKKGYFVHIPKTGGASIKNALPDECLTKPNKEGMLNYIDAKAPAWWITGFGPGGSCKHLSPTFPFFYYIVDKTKYNGSFKFSFVRNPFDRAVSSYAHQKKAISRFYTKCVNENDQFKYSTKFFPEFESIRSVVDLEELFSFSYFVSYLDKIFKYNKLMIDDSHHLPQVFFTHRRISENYFIKNIDFIGRFENIEQDYWKVCKFLDVEPQKLSHLRKGDRGSYKDYYVDETRKIIEKLYRDDLYYFGYKF